MQFPANISPKTLCGNLKVVTHIETIF